MPEAQWKERARQILIETVGQDYHPALPGYWQLTLPPTPSVHAGEYLGVRCPFCTESKLVENLNDNMPVPHAQCEHCWAFVRHPSLSPREWVPGIPIWILW